MSFECDWRFKTSKEIFFNLDAGVVYHWICSAPSNCMDFFSGGNPNEESQSDIPRYPCQAQAEIAQNPCEDQAFGSMVAFSCLSSLAMGALAGTCAEGCILPAFGALAALLQVPAPKKTQQHSANQRCPRPKMNIKSFPCNPHQPCFGGVMESTPVDLCDCWADLLRAIVVSLPENERYYITNIHGKRLREVEGHPGELREIPSPDDFPLDVNRWVSQETNPPMAWYQNALNVTDFSPAVLSCYAKPLSIFEHFRVVSSRVYVWSFGHFIFVHLCCFYSVGSWCKVFKQIQFWDWFEEPNDFKTCMFWIFHQKNRCSNAPQLCCIPSSDNQKNIMERCFNDS